MKYIVIAVTRAVELDFIIAVARIDRHVVFEQRIPFALIGINVIVAVPRLD